MNLSLSGVQCRFEQSGKLNIQKICLNGRWQSVEQGRQWRDDFGRHVLIMIQNQTFTLTLLAHTLEWELKGRVSSGIAI